MFKELLSVAIHTVFACKISEKNFLRILNVICFLYFARKFRFSLDWSVCLVTASFVPFLFLFFFFLHSFSIFFPHDVNYISYRLLQKKEQRFFSPCHQRLQKYFNVDALLLSWILYRVGKKIVFFSFVALICGLWQFYFFRSPSPSV